MARRGTRRYGHAGLAGCVTIRRSRKTGTLVGLYQAQQAGLETDPTTPWITVCEEHSTCVCHESLALARASLPDPSEWCEDCRERMDQEQGVAVPGDFTMAAFGSVMDPTAEET